uniref:Uncharacterized protein n=1 Tax=Rhizophora mucronata TaxID=61149 RepID=A0A2P2II74_RHIMU
MRPQTSCYVFFLLHLENYYVKWVLKNAISLTFLSFFSLASMHDMSGRFV